MSLLQNEDFLIYQLRSAYLTHIHDGVGERLITLNPSALNTPAFRAAGWTPSTSDLKRTYSPPIPTAVASEYFQAPPRLAGSGQRNEGEEEPEEGGMVTGMGSNDTVGPTLQAKRRRRKELLEEDDSSDLSDESEEEDEGRRAVQQIKFSKMPVRVRAGSSPLREAALKEDSRGQDGPSLLITSPSRPPESHGLRRASVGAVEAVKQRARRDTTTSSEMSSENEIDPAVFKRQKINPLRGTKQQPLAEKIREEDQDGADSDLEDDDVGDASDLSDEFEGVEESNSLLDLSAGPLGAVTDTLDGSPTKEMTRMPPDVTLSGSSPRKTRELPRLPSRRPISTVPPISLLSMALKTNDQKPEDPFHKFAELSGKGDQNPLWIKIRAIFSTDSDKPLEVPLRRTAKEGVQVTVAELIGLSLWRYFEEERKPTLKESELNVNRWTLRMVEDEEVDFDFPALGRTRPVVDFTLNNNRPQRGRARDKPWDEFALVRATDAEFEENERLTPAFSQRITPASATPNPNTSQQPSHTDRPTLSESKASAVPAAASFAPSRNPITGPSFALSAQRKESTAPLDMPNQPAVQSTPRTGAPKTVTIHHTDPQSFATQLIPFHTTTDTYIAELFDAACKRLNIDKALHVLKVRGTQTVAPSDRTVEALGDKLNLDLVRRRFVGDGAFGLSGSPGSASPGAPLLLTTGTTPTKKSNLRKGPLSALQPAQSRNDAAILALTGGKRYNVIRRQPMSFTPSHPRVLALDGEYMHILPGESSKHLANDNLETIAMGKTTSVHFSTVVGVKVSRKHPKMLRVFVWRDRETKRYDFEANSREEAAEVAGEIRRGMERFKVGDGG
ncbi:Component of a membrane-bound complex containing the Tor2p kinase [Elasticomyces elasticus]|nr:Component of a membrane-bound complex containing the Tor2p kinase [Elasticomyces elasticus]